MIDQPFLLTALGAASLLFAAYQRKGADWPAQPAALRSTPAPHTGRRRPGQSKGNGHGAGAEVPGQIPARGWWSILKRVGSEFMADRVMTEAAAITFFALLSIFPALAAMVSLYGLVADPATIEEQVKALSGVIPSGGLDLIVNQVHALASAGGGALGFGLIVGIATSLWTANQCMKSLFDALNVVYDETESRGYVKLTAITLLFTLCAILFVVLAMAAVVVLPAMLNFLGSSGLVAMALRYSRWPVLLVAIAALLSVIYHFGPSRARPRWRWVTWGSGAAAVGWLLVSLAFSYYVANFGSYDKTYGSLGAAIGFMTWIWISAIVVLAGGELNAETERQTARDTTVGPARPMGERGAVKADGVAPA